jgi:hypothetical protein
MILIGDECCGKMLTSSVFLYRLSRLNESGIDFAVVTPYLVPETEEHFFSFIKKLPKHTKIVVNDIGAFQIVKKSSHIPIIGRLLMRQNTDPAVFSFFQSHADKIIDIGEGRAVLTHMPPSKAFTEHLQSSPVFSEEAAKIFTSDDEQTAVIMDELPFGSPEKIPERFNVILNTGNILVSVLPCNDCSSCPNEETFLGMTRSIFPIYRKKNICYYKSADMPNIPSYPIPSYVSAVIMNS